MTIWNPTVSAGENMSGSTEQIRYNWTGLENWWDIEHQTFTSAGSGKHSKGVIGVALTGTTATIAAIPTPGTGSLALNTSLGEMQMYRYDPVNASAGWEGITDSKFSRIRKGLGSQSIPASTWTRITTSASTSGTYDGLTEYSSTRFVAVGAGYFLVVANVVWSTGSTDFNKGVAIYKNGNAVAIRRRHGMAVNTILVADILSLVAGDYLDVYVWHSGSGAQTETGGTFSISRID